MWYSTSQPSQMTIRFGSSAFQHPAHALHGTKGLQVHRSNQNEYVKGAALTDGGAPEVLCNSITFAKAPGHEEHAHTSAHTRHNAFAGFCCIEKHSQAVC